MGLFKRNSSSRYDRVQEHAGMSHPMYTGPKAGERIRQDNGQPNPEKYNIIRGLTFGRLLLLEVQFPDCTNYEGRKILVYQDVNLAQLREQGSIDPHFCNNPSYHAPIARFVPTLAGWQMAKQFCTLMRNLSS